jgi:hypothetical protein
MSSPQKTIRDPVRLNWRRKHGAELNYGQEVFGLQVSNIEQPVLSCVAYATSDRPKEAFMGGHPFPEIPCTICAKPVDLQADLTADENGKAAHEHCYVQHITSSNSNPPAPMMAD